jgi:hypothetical protein
MDEMAAAGAAPRLAGLLGPISLEDSLPFALGALGVLPVGREARVPQVLKARCIVGELGQELGDRVVGVRRGGSLRIVAVCGGHGVKILDRSDVVKGVDTERIGDRMRRSTAGG